MLTSKTEVAGEAYNQAVGAAEQSDGHSPQASSVTANAERKVSRRLELGVSSTHVNGLTGMSTPAGAAPTPPDDRPSKEKAALEYFAEYFAQNYHGTVVFHDPRWHAPKVFRAAMWALKQAEKDAAPAEPKPASNSLVGRALENARDARALIKAGQIIQPTVELVEFFEAVAKALQPTHEPIARRRPSLEQSDSFTVAEERDWWRDYALEIEARHSPPPAEALDLLRRVCNQWVNGRRVLDGIDKTVSDEVRAIITDECPGCGWHHTECVCRASVTKEERCSECRKPLPPLARWSMPACPECVEKAESEKDRAGRSAYEKYCSETDIHCNRLPAWSELDQRAKSEWIKAAHETSVCLHQNAVNGAALSAAQYWFCDCGWVGKSDPRTSANG